MSYAYFIIFRQEGQARVSRLLIPEGKEVPSAFRYQGGIYQRTTIQLCDGDHLLDAKRELMGFSFFLAGETDLGGGRLVRDCLNVQNESNLWINFVLNEDRPHQTDTCQRIFPVVYADEHSDHIILVNECATCWTALGFLLAMRPLPEPVFEDIPTT